MEIKNSPLQLRKSILTKLSVKTFIPTTGISNNITFDDYIIDLEFDILEPEKGNTFLVSTALNINNKGRKKIGYVISLKTDYIFQITDDNLNKKQIKNLKGLSSISIAISKLRGELERITEPYQFGTYHLPSIDMNNLFKKKNLEINIQNTKSKIKP